MAQATQAEVLIDAERRGELGDSGCRGVRAFAQTILRRSVHDASRTALVAKHLVCLPKLAAAYRTGVACDALVRLVLTHGDRVLNAGTTRNHRRRLTDAILGLYTPGHEGESRY